MTMTLEELIDNFSYLSDWEDKYRYLIELGEQMPPLPDDKKTSAYRVEGCMSSVWMYHTQEGERHYFYMDSDAHIVRGLEAVLTHLTNGKTASEIQALNFLEIFKQLGLESHLSQTRRNGFAAMTQKIHAAVS